MAMALFAISMLLRSGYRSRRRESLPGIELGLRSLVGVGWVVFAVKFFPRRAMIQGRSGAVLRSPFFLLVGLGCMFYAASYPFDKFEPVIFGLNSVLVEEVLYQRIVHVSAHRFRSSAGRVDSFSGRR